MKFSALNVDFNGLSFDFLRWTSPPYGSFKFGYNLQNVRYLLLSISTIAWKRLQIDTDLLLITRSSADELSRGTNIDNLERPWNRKKAF